MNILLCWPFFYPDSNAASARGMAFAKYLKKEGAQVSIITPIKKNNFVGSSEYFGNKIYRLKTYDSVANEKKKYISLFFSPISLINLYYFIKKLQPDIIISSTPGLFLSVETLIIAKLLDIPYIFDIRDTWEIEKFTHKGKIKNKLKTYLEKICCNCSTLIFAITPTLKETIIEMHNICSNKIKVVYNGVDLEKFPNFNIPKKYDLIFIGSPSNYRDLFRLFEGISQIINIKSDIKFLYLGWESTAYTKNVEEYIKKLGIKNNIILCPNIPHEQIPMKLMSSKIGIISLVDDPVFRSAVGTKTYEYLGAGLPIVCLGPSFDCELKKLIDENKVGIYTDETSLFAESVIYLLNNEKIRETLTENAHKTAKIFDMSRIVHEVYLKHIVNIANA